MKVIKKCNMRVIGKIMVFILAFQFVGMMCQNKILAEDTFRLTQYVQNFIIEVSDNEDFACWKECEVALEQNDVVRSKNGVIINRYTVYNENGIYGTVLCSENGEVAYYSLNDAVDEFVYGYCVALTLKTEYAGGKARTLYAGGGKIISGVTPLLQAPVLCIPGAASNVMWYYGKNFYSSIVGSCSDNEIKSLMSFCYAQEGGEANNNSPGAINRFLAMRTNSSLSASVSVNWYPSVDLLITEINDNKPVMLGFSGNNSYFSGAHMTMCYGYQITGGNTYACVANGHTTVPEFYIWDSSVNDCIITIHIN